MDWKNINLNSAFEVSRPILDPYTIETLLLEISCNLREINRETVIQQFTKEIDAKAIEAKGIFMDNLDNIVAHALKYREETN